MDKHKVKIAINGFGRIGRQALKAALGVTADSRMRLSPLIDPTEIKVVAINDLIDVRILAHLLKYDSAYGRYRKEILVEHDGEVVDWEGYTRGKDHELDLSQGKNFLIVGGERIRVLNHKNPKKLPWAELGVDLVIESTGIFTDYEKAKVHLTVGAKRVLISAPGKGEEGKEGKTIVLGTEAADEHLGKHSVCSNASCTTNSVAPIMQILHSQFGVKNSLMTTVHGYTASQNLVDGPNRKDLRRARAAAENIIPTSTGAATATTHTIPKLKGKFDGVAMRVPVVTGSISDITAVLKKEVTVQELNDTFKKMAENPLYEGILEVTQEPLVSTDIIGNPASAIVDTEFTRVSGANLAKVLVWYDNEWGYSNRLIEAAVAIGKRVLNPRGL